MRTACSSTIPWRQPGCLLLYLLLYSKPTSVKGFASRRGALAGTTARAVGRNGVKKPLGRHNGWFSLQEHDELSGSVRLQAQHIKEDMPIVALWEPLAPSASSLADPTPTVASDEPSAPPAKETAAASSDAGGGASMANLSTSLVKSIVGGGVLALPAGVAAMGDASDVTVPAALALIALTGSLNAYFFSMIGRVCDMTGASTYTQAWERSVGPSSRPLVALVVLLKTAMACLIYSMILGDSFQSLAGTLTGLDISRTTSIVTVTLTALLPLCLQANMQALAPFSAAGIIGMVTTAFAIMCRATDGTYQAPTGDFLSQLPDHMQPSFGGSHFDLWQGLVLTCTLATAFVAHYNAPRFYDELENKSVERFDTVVGLSFGTAAVLFAMVAIAGYLTFGSATEGLILNNYAVADPLIALCRMAVAGSMVVTFPLPFLGLRDGLLDVLPLSEAEKKTDSIQLWTSMGLLAAVTSMACLVQDLTLVLSVGGGTFSTLVASVFPTLMFKSATEKQQQQQDRGFSTFLRKNQDEGKKDVDLAVTLMGVCVSLGLTGVFLALEQTFMHA